jgi:hypothetical protein
MTRWRNESQVTYNYVTQIVQNQNGVVTGISGQPAK